MKAPESAIDVKMYEFGRLIDAVEETWADCEALADYGDQRHAATARGKNTLARNQLMDTIRVLVDLALSPNSAARSSEEAPSTAGGGGKSEHLHAPGLSLTSTDVKRMVDRFLSWKLPDDFKPDCGISYRFGVGGISPTGTNLLDARQATEMVQHMTEGLSLSSQDRGTA